MQLALQPKGYAASLIYTPFDRTSPVEVKKALGVGVSTFDVFMYRMRQLAERKVTQPEATAFANEVFEASSFSAQAAEKATDTVMTLFAGKGIGATLEAANETAWGLFFELGYGVRRPRASCALAK